MAQVPDLSQRPENLHQRLTSPDDEEVDPLLEQTGCARPYTVLEECLGDNDRDWTKCQKGGGSSMSGGANPAQVLLLYRRILKAAQRFPSIKRDAIIADIKAQFHEHKELTDPDKVRHELRVALRSLQELEQYAMAPSAEILAIPTQGRALTDPDKVRHELRVALRSLQELEQYAVMDSRASAELEVSLRGSCE
ncbi:hypothetical protein COHA_004185 [Chlorella ohadii]|uniref:Complex 1 LYR protein domain-containing protein n=1 Tax=Chlorella ohadii TaxID=2649997 RepID=A0AAD5DQ47_9CHLO|nr:hypothetical protein COHA_004185 [Chlorella ohadii]